MFSVPQNGHNSLSELKLKISQSNLINFDQLLAIAGLKL